MLLISFSVIHAQAQSLERQVIGTAGTYQSASWGSLSSTAGECMTHIFSTSSFVLTQGFQQARQEDLMVYDASPGTISVNVFPVPAADIINVVITGIAGKHYSVRMFDLPGQELKLSSQDLSSGTETRLIFDLSPLANGAYLMLISDEHNLRVKTIKFNKIN